MTRSVGVLGLRNGAQGSKFADFLDDSRLEQMTRAEQESRFQELCQDLGTARPETLKGNPFRNSRTHEHSDDHAVLCIPPRNKRNLQLGNLKLSDSRESWKRWKKVGKPLQFPLQCNENNEHNSPQLVEGNGRGARI